MMFGTHLFGTHVFGPDLEGSSTALRYVIPVSITPKASPVDPLYLASLPLRHPSRYYEPRIRSYGSFTRSIAAPAGFVRTGDVSLEITDPDNSIRQRIAAKTIRKASVEIAIGRDTESFAGYQTLLKREIGTVIQSGDGILEISLDDIVNDMFEQEIPGLINTDFFPDLPDNNVGDFAPIIFGEVESSYGAIRCFYVDDANYRYLVARHRCLSIEVYRRLEGEETFAKVTSGYSAYYEAFGSPPSQYFTYIEFTSDQGAAEIRANVSGMYDVATGQLINNNFPDAIKYLLIEMGIEESADYMNLDSFSQALIDMVSLACNGAITEKMNWGEAISRLQRSSNIDLFSDKDDLLTVKYTKDDDASVATIDDLTRIFAGSIIQNLADPAFNRITYRYSPNYASGAWIEDVWDNDDDQALLGEVVEGEPVNMYFVRDAVTAAAVAHRRGQYLDLDSFQIEAVLPLIPTLNAIELADIVTIAHFGGMKSGGFTAEEFKIIELTADIDNLKYLMRGIRRRLAEEEIPEQTWDIDVDSSWSQSGLEAATQQIRYAYGGSPAVGLIFILTSLFDDSYVKVYDTSGSLQTTITPSYTPNYGTVACIGADANYVYLCDQVIDPLSPSTVDLTIKRYTHAGSYQGSWAIGTGPNTYFPFGCHADGSYFYVTSQFGLQKWSLAGVKQYEEAHYGTGEGKFQQPVGVFSDGTNVFILEKKYTTQKILKYLCSDGSFVSETDEDVPAYSSGIVGFGSYLVILTHYGVSIFNKSDLSFVETVLFDENEFDPWYNSTLDNDGTYLWAIDNTPANYGDVLKIVLTSP